VSTSDQTNESQKNLISRYCMDTRMLVDEWIAIEKSSKKSTRERRIEELIQKLAPGDVVIISELSRLGRSIREVLHIIERIVNEKQCRIIMIKQNLDINPRNTNNMTNKVLLTVFSMLAELERDFISERTKEGLHTLKAKGVTLGKPRGIIQGSMYDKDKEKIFHLYKLGVPIREIINKHLQYGKYLSLMNYVKKRYNGD
jgi:DNA invertase Pin-like site-specific DNA recombinase